MSESLFPNVPERLTDAVGAIPENLKSEVHRYTAAGAFVSVEYLRKDLIGAAAHPFTAFKANTDGYVSWEQPVRIGILGENLFLLRDEPGFQEICRRLRGHNLRAAFYEALAARLFRDWGFSIEMRIEGGTLGEDFHFIAINGAERVNVEVTALEASRFSEGTLKTALNRKREQLSPTEPGVIVCVYPESWLAKKDLLVALKAIAERFLRGTGRVNHVLFAGESKVPLAGQTGALLISCMHVASQAARYPAPMATLALQNRSLGQLDYRTEFSRWVDWALERQPSS